MLDALTRPFGWRLPSLAIKIASYAFVGAALMLYINYPTLQEYFQARQRRESYSESVAALKKEYSRLLREQAELKNGGFETEKTIRERLRMVKPGERILFIDPPADSADSAEETRRRAAGSARAIPTIPKIAEILKESIAPKEAPDAKEVVEPPVEAADGKDATPSQGKDVSKPTSKGQ